MNNGLELLVKVPANCVNELFAKGLESVISQCTIEFPQATKAPAAAAVVVNNNAPKEESSPVRVHRKLIKFRCDEFGDLSHLMCIKDADGKYRIRCRSCGKDFAFAENDLRKVEYTCKNCNESNYFFMPDVEDLALDWDSCRNCRADIALTYFPTLRMYGAK